MSIVIGLKGGLGNQMFQYSAGLSLAKINSTDLLIDTSWFNSVANEDTSRKYELDCFEIHEKMVDKKDIKIISESNKVRSILNRLGNDNSYTEHKESSTRYDNKFRNLRGNIYMDGYFQSEMYFRDIRSDLIRNFSFKDELSLKNKNIIKNIQNTNSVSIHVRRGDYVSNKNANNFHGVQVLDYYKKAISILEHKIKKPKYFIFSDDIDWCKKNLPISKSIFFVENRKGSEDLRIMIECKHNIIANSSFSWWGAWLGNEKNKIVIAPINWFKLKEADSSDIIPSRWQKI